MKKRLLSALCAVMLLICAVPMASAQTGDAARRADALTVLHLLSEDPGRNLTTPATREDVALFAKHVGPNVKIKAAGGIANLQDAEDFINLGASRLGTSRIVKAVKAMEK